MALAALMIIIIAVSALCTSCAGGKVRVTFSAEPKGEGRIEGDRRQTLERGEKTTPVRAVANDGYMFVCWSDGEKSKTHPAASYDSDTEIIAQFEKLGYTVIYEAMTGGSIKGKTTQKLAPGEKAEKVEAVADDGFEFIGWSDGRQDAKRKGETFDSDAVIVACFQAKAYTIKYEARAGGTILGDAVQQLQKGQTAASVTAVPDAQFAFDHWSDGSTESVRTGDAFNFDTVIVASFTRVELTINYSAEANGKILGQTSQNVREGEGTTMVRAVADAGYQFTHWSDGSKKATREGDDMKSPASLVAYFEPITPFARLDIKTADSQKITSKTEYKDATFTLTGAANESYNFENLPGRIRGRGNSTWDNFKRVKPSYRVEFDEKIHFLGLGDGADDDWVLICNYSDISMLRDWCALRLGELFENVSFSASTTYVQVYLNGSYQGLYQLCERIETSSSRIDIEDKSNELDRGYLFELDKRGDEGEGKLNVNYFYIDEFEHEIVVKGEDMTHEQYEFISKYIQEMSKAIISGNRDEIDKYVDIPSLIDMCIIEELCSDRDVGFASFYFYKEPGGKVYFTAPWDVDLGLGNDASYPDVDDRIVRKNIWYKTLLTKSWYKKEFYERLCEKKDDILSLADEVERMGELLASDAEQNYKKFRTIGTNTFYSPYKVYSIKTYEGHVEYLANWIRERCAWMLRYYQYK